MKKSVSWSELVSPFKSALSFVQDVPEDEGQHLQDVFPRATETGGTKFGCHDEAYLDEQSPLISPENAHRLWNSWSRWWDPNKSVFVFDVDANRAF